MASGAQQAPAGGTGLAPVLLLAHLAPAPCPWLVGWRARPPTLLPHFVSIHTLHRAAQVAKGLSGWLEGEAL